MISYRRCYTYCNSFLFNDTATTEIYTLSLHDALPISSMAQGATLYQDGKHRVLLQDTAGDANLVTVEGSHRVLDRKSTRLNSSHANISYAVFCLKKK